MKRIIVALVISLMLVASLASAAFAADPPTTTTVSWSGSTGVVTGTVTVKNDATTSFGVNTAGTSTGTFTVTGSNNNPYGYGVDSTSGYMTATINNGSMYFQSNRTDSYAPMYGTSGQTVYNFVGSSGTGAMATGTGSNYASMGNGTYGQPHTAGGYNYEAGGSSYTIQQFISSNAVITPTWGGYGAAVTSNAASFSAIGNGSAVINSMTTGASASGAQLGWGGGSYTNATAALTGSGTFRVDATGTNQITTPISGASGSLVAGGWTVGGTGTFGSTSLSIISNFTNGASVGNFSVNVN